MSKDFWDGRTVMVTGGAGFLGSHLIEKLKERAPNAEIFVPRSSEYDLCEEADIRRAFTDSGADVVIHLAATVGGIGANRDNPGRYFYDNAIMGIELMEMARQFDVDKFTILGTICSYPKHTPVPFEEENLFDGYPEETNAPYGIAKKALLTQSKAYRKQYDFNSVYLMPVNLYGPRDDFNLETSHVIPAIIRKCVEARENNEDSITAWGTGEPTREFLYVKDAAEGIIRGTEELDESTPINLGSGMEISIKELINLIADLTNFEGEISWDTSKPDGQPRRRLDTSRAKEKFDWEASTEFKEGLRETIEWYENHRDEIVE
ncbi:GDP-L-fucose synthase family protein [Halobaculum rarum]|uniref:GDP-L-fucose synthase family protein n=1 Tax=Halobaculum rarum TaxID=3075122 RepID=UPI0032AF8182